MTNDAPPEIKEYTPEQRKLLAKAYRLILSWPRKIAEQVQSTACSDEMTASRKPALPPSIDVASLPENKQG
ncbi:MAG: hypothetical protein HZB19_14840 [Chloroflexi bacterium]|nr:hypothetical protein [Chloroflexota bacterium]